MDKFGIPDFFDLRNSEAAAPLGSKVRCYALNYTTQFNHQEFTR